jgi:transposase-like protein
MAKNKRITDAKRQKIYDDILHGASFRSAARKHKVSVATVSKIKKEFEDNSPVPIKPKKRKPVTKRTKKKIKEGIAVSKMVKESDIIIGNILDVGRAIIKGAKKLDDIADNSQQRVDDILKGLTEVREMLEDCIEVKGNDRLGAKSKEDLMKHVYKILGLISSYYSSNKIVIEAIRELRGHAETYLKIKMGADVMQAITNFADAIFEGAEKLSDKEYIKFRDIVIERSELGRQLFSKYDPNLQG